MKWPGYRTPRSLVTAAILGFATHRGRRGEVLLDAVLETLFRKTDRTVVLGRHDLHVVAVRTGHLGGLLNACNRSTRVNASSPGCYVEAFSQVELATPGRRYAGLVGTHCHVTITSDDENIHMDSSAEVGVDCGWPHRSHDLGYAPA